MGSRGAETRAALFCAARDSLSLIPVTTENATTAPVATISVFQRFILLILICRLRVLEILRAASRAMQWISLLQTANISTHSASFANGVPHTRCCIADFTVNSWWI